MRSDRIASGLLLALFLAIIGCSDDPEQPETVPDVWSFEPAAAQDLLAVWGSSGTDLHAVGDAGTILHHDGTGWSSDTNGDENDLHYLWGDSTGYRVAVGKNGTVLAYDGEDWTPLATDSDRHLYGVWGSSAEDIYAVGENGTILHYDGTTWEDQSFLDDMTVSGIWGLAANDIYAIAYGASKSRILHYNGSSWAISRSEIPGLYWTIGGSLSEVFIGGEDGAVLRRRGTEWDTLQVPGGNDIGGLWTSPEGITIAVGRNGTALRFNGNLWEEMTAGSSWLTDVWGFSANDIHAVGHEGQIWRYDGNGEKAWEAQSGIPSGSTYRAVAGRAYDDVYVIAADGNVLQYNGIMWSTLDLSDEQQMLDVWCHPTENIAVAVGSGGAIFYQVGPIWTAASAGTDVDLHAVWGRARDEIYIVGAEGTILRGNGATWEADSSGTRAVLCDVWGISTGERTFAAGWDGTLLVRAVTGEWTPHDTGTTQTLHALWGSSEENLFAVGWWGTVLHFDGTTWSTLARLTTHDLYGAWGGGDDQLLAVGAAGTVLYYDGARWDLQASGTTANLFGVWGSSAVRVYISGEGTIISGERWPQSTSAR